MRLRFPNPSRSFDSSRNRVRFWGYDQALEIAFLLEEEALEKLCPDMKRAEAGFLAAFDAERTRIHEAADRAYERSGRRSHVYCLACVLSRTRTASSAQSRTCNTSIVYCLERVLSRMCLVAIFP